MQKKKKLADLERGVLVFTDYQYFKKRVLARFLTHTGALRT